MEGRGEGVESRGEGVEGKGESVGEEEELEEEEEVQVERAAALPGAIAGSSAPPARQHRPILCHRADRAKGGRGEGEGKQMPVVKLLARCGVREVENEVAEIVVVVVVAVVVIVVRLADS